MLFSFSMQDTIFAQNPTTQDLQPKKTGLPGRTVWALATSGTSSVTTFAATDKGLWRSTDNGTSWTETTLKNQGVYAVKSRQIGSTMTLLVGTDKGVLRSTDGGNSWASPEVTTGTVVVTSNILSLKKVFDIEIVGTSWFAATEKGVFRSTNDGRTWALVNIDRTADNNEVRGITAEGNTVIVNLWKEGLWRSTNGGSSWTKLTIAGETSLAKSVFAHTGRMWVQQGNKSTTATVSMLFVGAVSGNVWRSTDNGSTWTKSLAAGTALRSALAAPTGVDVLTSAGTALISGTPTGLAVSNDNGTTWQSFSTSLPQPIALVSDNKNLYVGVQQSSTATLAEKGASSLNNTAPGVGTFSTPAAGQASCAVPTVNSFTPPSVIAGGSAVTVTINGANFESGTQYQTIVINEITGNQIYQQTLTSGQNIGGIGVTYNTPNSSTLSLSSAILATTSRIGITPYTPKGCSIQAAGPGYTLYIALHIPTVSGIEPATFLRGGNNTPATIFGTNFEPGAKVYLYHPSLPGGKFELGTTFVNANTLQAVWSRGIFFYIGAASTVEVGVENPSGGVASIRQTLSIVNPAPVAGGLSITQISAGASSPLVISGTGYYDGSQVYLEGQLKPSTFSNGSLTINLTGSDIPTARTYSVVVVNPAPGGGSTQPMSFNVVNLTPFITAFTPTVLALGQDATLTLSGGDSFVSGAVAYLGAAPLTTTFVNSNTLTASIPGSSLTTASETAVSLRVLNPAPGGGFSNTITLPVRNPAASLTGISPNALVSAPQAVALTLSGSNFLTGAEVLISGGAAGANTPLTATVVSANQITATLPANLAASIGQYSLIVRNPNAVGDSPAQPLSVVYPQAQLSSVSPSTITVGASALTLTLDGSNFIAGASVLWDGALLTPTSLTANRITVSLSAAQLAFSAAHTVLVRNPQPNLGESGTLFVAVRNPAPVLTSLTPTLLLTNLATPPTITLTGSGFGAESRVLLRPLHTSDAVITIQPTVNSATQVSFPLPLNLISASARYSVRVQNPALPNNIPAGSPFGGQGGGVSDSLLLSAQNPVPTLSAITPAALLAGEPATTFTLTGTNFLPSLRVLVNGSTTSAQNVALLSPTSLQLTLPASALAAATTLTVQVALLPPGGGFSAARTVSITNPLPVLDSIAPAVIGAFRDTVIAVFGSGFTPLSQVRLVRGTTTVTLAIVQLPSSGTALVAIPAAAIQTVATYQVRVFNGTPGGGTSVSRNLNVQTGPAVSMEFLNVTTGGIVAGASLNAIAPGVRVRFRDAANLLTDITNDSLYAVRLPDSQIPDTVRRGMRLTRVSQGLYSVPSTIFTTAGTYTLTLGSAAPPTLTTFIGQRTFLVRPTIRANVWIEFFNAADSAITSLTATQALAKLRLTYRDRFQNLTDSAVGIVRLLTVAGNPWGASTATLTLQRTAAGLYNLAAPLSITTAGTYYVNPAGLSRAVVATTAMDSLVVSPAQPTAYIRSLRSTLAAGTSQPAMTMTVRDGGNNRIDLAAPRLIALSRDTLADGTRTELAWTLTRTALGTYTAPALLFTQGGEYLLRAFDDTTPIAAKASGFTTDSIFTVGAAAATRLEIASADTLLSPFLPDTVRAGASLPRLRFLFRDASGNPTDNGVTLTSATYRVAVGVSTGTLRLERQSVGTYWLSSTQASVFVTSGTYTLSVRNILPDSITVNGILPGRRTFIVAPGAAATVLFTSVTPAFNAGGNQAAFRLQFRDALGNAAPVELTEVQFSNATSSSIPNTGVIALTQTGTGAYTAAVTPFTVSGNYTLAVNVPNVVKIGTSAFMVRALATRTVEFSDVPDTLWTAQPLPPVLVRFRDLYGNLTNDSRSVTFTKTGSPASTGTVALNPLGTGVYTTAGTVFWRSGNYTLSVSGISAANSLGKRMLYVRSDTLYAMRLDSIVPRVFDINDSLTHHWTIRILGEHFLPSSFVVNSFNSILYPTTFVSENELFVTLPQTLRTVGLQMLEVHSPGSSVNLPPNSSQALPLLIIDPSIQSHAIMEVLQPTTPILLLEEQLAYSQIQQRQGVQATKAVLINRATEMVLSEKLHLTLLNGIDATVVMGKPKQVGANDYSVSGYVENDSTHSPVDIAITDSKYVGMTIKVDGVPYRIEPIGDRGVHVISKIDAALIDIGICGSDGSYSSKDAILTSDSPIIGCDGRTIRVLYVAIDGSNAVPNQSIATQIKSRLQTQLQVTNLIFNHSLIWTGKQPVKFEAANNGDIVYWDYRWESYNGSFISSPNFIGDLDYLEKYKVLNNSSQIRWMRNKYKADIVVFITDTYLKNGKVAIASQLGTPKHPVINHPAVPSPSPHTATILLDGGRFLTNSALNQLLGHEIGHILGGLHGIGSIDYGSPDGNNGHGFESVSGNIKIPDLMNWDPDAGIQILSSPLLKWNSTNFNQGVTYAIRQTYDLNTPISTMMQYTTIAQNGDIPMGKSNESDATLVIDQNIPEVANYRQTNLSVDLSNVPSSLKKGECATISIRLSGCNSNAYRYIYSLSTSTQQIAFENQQIPGSQILTKTVCMPNDGSKYLQGFIFFETFAKTSEYYNLENYSSTPEYFIIPCSDCTTQLFAASEKSSALLSSGHSQMKERTEKEIYPQVLLYQNNPNPFSEKTDIRFVLSRKANINLTVYNALGQIIATLADTSMNAGEYTIPFEAQHLASGTYTYRLTVDGQATARTMVILK